jgi:hypothetical protein
MKNYVGRKIRGFRFEDDTDGVIWYESMIDNIDKIGEIIEQRKSVVRIRFDNRHFCYPISLIEPHLIEEETPEIIDLTNVKSVEMMVSQDEEDWFKAKVIAKLVDAYIDNQGNAWYYVKAIQQLPQYTHAELVEKIGHDFEIIE